MLFGALFSSYILIRVGAAAWPHGSERLNIWLAMLNTFILIGSSVTVVMAWASLKMNDYSKYLAYMWTTVALACGFLVVKAIEYGTKFSHGLAPSTDVFYAIYFTLTGLHGLHVIGGIVVFVYFLLFGKKMWETQPERFAGRIECTGLYWHFVDLVWIFLFPSLYLL
jgi:heme/copper-type cytochrome/quinol oxidase subunit 3